jgi:hypothetical protein
LTLPGEERQSSIIQMIRIRLGIILLSSEQNPERSVARKAQSRLKSWQNNVKNTLFIGKSRMPEVPQFKAQGSLLSLTFAPSKNEVKRT